MELMPATLIGGFYADESLPWSAQRTVNWLPETAEVEGTRTVTKLLGLPGLRAVVDFGNVGGIRGVENAEEKLFVVTGDTLYQVFTDFTFDAKGNIPGVSRVSMTHSKLGGTTSELEVSIANGLSGYVYNTQTDTLVQITDEAFEGANTFDYVDGYTSFTDPQGRFWGHSDLNQATSYISTDRSDAESAPDRIVSHIVSHREVMVFGTRTTEFFRNAPTATATFQRVDGTEMEVGIAAPFARVRLDNTVYWLGNDGHVYRLEGHSPRRVSVRPVEQVISKRRMANCFAMAWEDRGHKVVYFTFTDGETFGFDVATGLWHQRRSHGLNRWRINTLTRWNNLWIAGDYARGKLYVLDWEVFDEDGAPLVAERVTGVSSAHQNKIKVPYFEALIDTGNLAADDHFVMIDYSNDGGRNFSNIKYRSIGATGEYEKRIRLNRTGKYRNRCWRIRISSPCKRDLLGGSLQPVRTSG